MLSAYTGAQVREAEQPLLAAGGPDALMGQAAYGLYAECVRLLLRRRGACRGSTAVVLAGSGNNGGDALYAGTHLLRRGIRTTAVLAAGRAHPRALQAFTDRGGSVEILDPAAAPDAAAILGLALECAQADLIIDGILGTGARGGLRGLAAGMVRAVSGHIRAAPPQSRPAVVACDLPSGVDADTGAVCPPVLPADVTVTFGGPKLGLLTAPGALAAGDVAVVDIGLGPYLPDPALRGMDAADVAELYPRPQENGHKYSRGVLGIAAGSAQYPGAAVLATGAALATGVGMVRYLGPAQVAAIINTVHPEAVCSGGRAAGVHVQAWLVGPGTGEDADQRQRARDAIESGLPTIVDASALPLAAGMAAGPQLGPQVILTPHAGELRSLLGARGVDASRAEIESAPVEYARRAAQLTGATVLLKGAVTVVAAPSGELFASGRSTPWLATAGTGDTLAGILGALAATLAEDDGAAGRIGLPVHLKWAAAAAAAAFVHAAAGRRAARAGPVVTAELPAHIGATISELAGPERPRNF